VFFGDRVESEQISGEVFGGAEQTAEERRLVGEIAVVLQAKRN